jgi:AraC-like DNA-binding protein
MDALAAVVSLLKPQAVGVKIIHGAGRWGVQYPAFSHPSFALILKGRCWLAAEGFSPSILETGDFILFPTMPGFTMGSDAKARPKSMKPVPGEQADELFHGDSTSEPSVSQLGGYFIFDPVNASMLLDRLPRKIHIRATDSASGGVATIIELLRREAKEKRDGRALVLTRLIEVILVEALRSAQSDLKAKGLLAGLRDPQLAIALRCIHTRTTHPWTLSTLAREAGMSRSSLAERFAREIGMTPLNYLLQWRLAVAKDLLVHGNKTVAETAIAVGYESASGFSTAFSRETGRSPREFTRLHRIAGLSKAHRVTETKRFEP